MATVTGLTLIKSFTYRGTTDEEWSNKYHFKGPPPGDDASWAVLADDVWREEQLILPPAVTLVKAYGYDDNSSTANHVWARDFRNPGPPPTGTLAPPAGAHPMSGDQAAIVEWATDAKSTRGKTIYLRKYFHAGYVDSADPDLIPWPGYGVHLQTYADQMAVKHGGLRSAQRDLNVTQKLPMPYVSTRTLKHRGKRGGPKARASAASS